MSDVSGFIELERAITQMTQEMKTETKRALEETATEIIAEAQSRTPVLSGDLRRSWTHDEVKTSGNTQSVELGTAIIYSEPVEEGSRRGNSFVEGKHMLKDSVTIGAREFEAKIDNIVSMVFGGR